ncbi:maleylpyruvate isomerase N-terminal domain-containing protein [Actinoplanes sp. NPDC004185]
MATRDWTVADSAAHVLSLVSLYLTFFDPGAEKLPVPDLQRVLSATTVDTVNRANAIVLANLPDRTLERMAGDLDSALERLLRASGACDPGVLIPWLGDARVPAVGVLAHLVNEFLVHGWDMAQALGRAWPIPDADAALFFEQFLVGMIRHDHGILLETGSRTSRRPIGVEFRSALTAPTLLVLEGRRVRIGERGEPADARITFRPAGLNLMLFGRASIARALVRRDIAVSGPRPWLLVPFIRVMHLPHN